MHSPPTSPAPAADNRMFRQMTALLLLSFLLILAVLGRGLLSGRVYTYDDLGNFYLPIRFLYHNALLHGDSFLWTPAYFCGAYAQGEGQAGMTHPLHLLLYRLLPLETAFNVEFVASYAILFPGMALLLRRLDLPRHAALLGALLFTFSGFTLLHSNHINALGVILHIPWLLLAIDVALRTADPRKAAGAYLAIALLTGSQCLMGYPQYVWFSLVGEYAFALLLLARRAASPRRLVRMALATVLGLALGAVQILPTLDALTHSVRHAPGLSFRLSGSLTPINLLQLWTPYVIKNHVYGNAAEEGVYNGVFCTVALVWLWLRRREVGPGQALLRPLAGFAALMLVCALGRYGGVYTLLAQLPGLSLFRFPTRYIVLLHLAMATLAAIAFTDLGLLQQRRETVAWARLRPLLIPVALCLVTVAAPMIGRRLVGPGPAGHASWPDHFAGVGYGLVSVALVCLVTGLVALAARGVRWCLPALVVVTVLDCAAWGLRYPLVFPPQTVPALLGGIPSPPEPGAGQRLYVPNERPFIDILMMKGYRLSGGYLGLNVAQALNDAAPNAQRVAGISWAYDHETWRAVPAPLPRARLLTAARTSDAVAEDLARIDVAATALVDRPLDLPAGTPGEARILIDRPGHIEVETVAATRQLLALSESYHDGWQIEIDGHPAPLLRVYGDFMGCLVEPGRQHVALRFEPASFRRGLIVSLVALILALAVFIRQWLYFAPVAPNGEAKTVRSL